MKKIVSFILAFSMIVMMASPQYTTIAAQDSSIPATESATSQPVSSESVSSEPVLSESVSSEPVLSESVSSEPEGKLLFGEELYNYIMSLSEQDQEIAISALTKEQLQSVEDWLDKEEKPSEVPIIEPVENGAVSFTDVGPFLPPVVGKAPVYARNLAWEQKTATPPVNVDTEGLVINKSISEPINGKYTITLEAYVEGTLTSSTVTKNVPTDIVLVLDQSGSMKDPFGYTTTYKSWSGNNKNAYSNSENLHVKEGKMFYKVSISRIRTTNNFGSSNDDYKYTYTYTGANGEITVTTPDDAKNNPPPEGWDFYTKQTASISRQQALKDAVTNFVSSVQEKTIGTDGTLVDHKIAMVGFAYDSDDNYKNTELLTPSEKNYSGLTATDYKEALVPVSVDGIVNANLTNAINNIKAEGATYIQCGLKMANKILENNSVPPNQKRNQVVIVFTDGYPGEIMKEGLFNTGNYNEANAAIKEAKIIKDAKATVYTVGVFAGSNPNFDISGITKDNYSKQGEKCANAYMHYMSTNYKSATSLITPGDRTKPVENNYYLSAKDQTDLDNIFETISDNIENGEATIELGTDAVVKDIISPYFKLPANTTNNDIKVYTQDYMGKNASNVMTWGPEQSYSGASIATSGKDVSVTNFDFSNNYVADATEASGSKAKGKKLIIKLPIELDRDSTFGGVQVPTNEARSGVYQEGALLENFISPTVDIPLKYDYSVSDKYEFITRSIDLKNVLGKASGYYADGINNAYVDIKYSIKNGKDEIATFEIPAGIAYEKGIWKNAFVVMNDNLDKDIKVECTVTAVNNRNQLITLPKSTKLYVYLPTFICTDSTVDFGDSVPLGDRVSGPQWSTKNGVKPDSLVSAPVLTLTYEHMEDMLNYENMYTVKDKNNFRIASVKIDQVEIKPYTIITKAVCTDGEHAENRDFTIHFHKYELTIQKDGANLELDPHQTFIFNVVGGPDQASFKVAIQGNQSKTIVGLKKGEYQVSEDINWSWRYAPKIRTQTIQLNATDTPTKKQTVTVVNSRTKDSWLSGDNFVTNLFNKKRQGA